MQPIAPLIFRLLARLPLRALHAAGAAVGWLTYGLSPRYRRQLRANLKSAGLLDRALARAAVGEAGKSAAELPAVWMRSPAEVLALVREVSGQELVEEARRRGQGIIYLTPHLGCFEITAQYLVSQAPITVLYRAPRQGWLQPLIEHGRGGGRLGLAPADLGGVRLLIRALKRKEAIGMLPDQVPAKGEGLWADFFGRPAYTMSLAARFTETTQAAMLFVYAERLPRGEGFHLHFSRPPQPVEGTLGERVAAINHGLETIIRQCPAQYLWAYNRYKRPAGAEPPPVESSQ